MSVCLRAPRWGARGCKPSLLRALPQAMSAVAAAGAAAMAPGACDEAGAWQGQAEGTAGGDAQDAPGAVPRAALLERRSPTRSICEPPRRAAAAGGRDVDVEVCAPLAGEGEQAPVWGVGRVRREADARGRGGRKLAQAAAVGLHRPDLAGGGGGGGGDAWRAFVGAGRDCGGAALLASSAKGGVLRAS